MPMKEGWFQIIFTDAPTEDYTEEHLYSLHGTTNLEASIVRTSANDCLSVLILTQQSRKTEVKLYK